MMIFGQNIHLILYPSVENLITCITIFCIEAVRLPEAILANPRLHTWPKCQLFRLWPETWPFNWHKSRRWQSLELAAFIFIDKSKNFMTTVANLALSCSGCGRKVSKDLFMSFGTIFWYVILGWYYNILGWKLSKQTSYWSKTGFFFSVKNHNFSSQNIIPK